MVADEVWNYEQCHNCLRVGDWRIIYTVRDDELLIAVIEIGSRGDVYRNYECIA